MRDLFVLLIYIPLSFISLLTAVLTLRRGRTHLSRNILFLSVVLFCWQLINILFFSTKSFSLSFFLFDLDLPFVALTSLGFFLLTLRFYSLDALCSKSITVALLVIPAVTMLLALTNHLHDFLRTGPEILSVYPVHSSVFVRGFWFWVHAAYSYLLTLISIAVALYQYWVVPRPYKLSSRLFLLGSAVPLLGNLPLLLGLQQDFPLDFTLIACSFSLLILAYASSSNQSLTLLNEVRSDIFNQLSSAIFILDNDDRILRENRTAHSFFDTLCPVAPSTTRTELLLALSGCALSVRDSEVIPGSQDYVFPGGETPRVYNLHDKPLLDARGRHIGTFLSLTDVTENRLLLRRLEEEVGQDALTGLTNRKRLEEHLLALDAPENLPLSLLVADLNGLKTVNDTLGHQQGDLLLRVAANTLQACTPSPAKLGRIGGDEFLMLLPRCNEAQAEKLILGIQRRALQRGNGPLTPSFALGFATKHRPEEKADEIFALADQRMYAHKAKERAKKAEAAV